MKYLMMFEDYNKTEINRFVEQIQDIVMGTISGMITSGDLINEMPGREMPEMNEPMPEQMQGQVPPEMMQGQMAPPQQPMALPPEGMQQ